MTVTTDTYRYPGDNGNMDLKAGKTVQVVMTLITTDIHKHS
jgi:hypothetical protein